MLLYGSEKKIDQLQKPYQNFEKYQNTSKKYKN
jgi:hypothetical protein